MQVSKSAKSMGMELTDMKSSLYLGKNEGLTTLRQAPGSRTSKSAYNLLGKWQTSPVPAQLSSSDGQRVEVRKVPPTFFYAGPA